METHLPSWDGRIKDDIYPQQNRDRYLLGITAANGECGKNGDSDSTC
jgi:hypothetical protein